MCLICVEYQKQRMTIGEARDALSEMVDTEAIDDEHAEEVEEMLEEAEEEEEDAARTVDP